MQLNVPDFLKNMLESQYGKELTNKIIKGYCKKRYTTFRVNTLKSDNKEIEDILKTNNIEFENVKNIKDAYIVKKGNEQTLQNLSIYEEGKIYLQSLSSMLPPVILQPEENEDILDMCAAPGGKTTQIAAITQNKAHITACEMNKIRLDKLKYNIEKQGANSIYLMNTDARNIDNFFSFDKILLDAPCSGSGTLNINDEKIFKYFTLNLIQKSVKAQTALLKKAIKILKPGSEMVYSTCSILACENEDIINNALKEGLVQIVPIENNFIKELPLLPTSISGTLCIMPNELYEGFFVAKLRKK